MTEKSAWTSIEEKRYIRYIGSYGEDFESHGCKRSDRKAPEEVWIDNVLRGSIDCYGKIYLRDRINRLQRYIESAELREMWGDIDIETCLRFAETELTTAKQLLGE